MWIYRAGRVYDKDTQKWKYEENVFHVGYLNGHDFIVVETHPSREEARRAVNYLNGGS